MSIGATERHEVKPLGSENPSMFKYIQSQHEILDLQSHATRKDPLMASCLAQTQAYILQNQVDITIWPTEWPVIRKGDELFVFNPTMNGQPQRIVLKEVPDQSDVEMMVVDPTGPACVGSPASGGVNLSIGARLYQGVKELAKRAGEAALPARGRSITRVRGSRHRSRSASPEIDSCAWILDSGCGHDLIDEDTVERAQLSDSIEQSGDILILNTANGARKVESEISLSIRELHGEEVRPKVLPKTPLVLSLGRRCLDEGYKFVWQPYSSSPVLTTPLGQNITMTVDKYIPYLLTGSPSDCLAMAGVSAGAKHPEPREAPNDGGSSGSGGDDGPVLMDLMKDDPRYDEWQAQTKARAKPKSKTKAKPSTQARKPDDNSSSSSSSSSSESSSGDEGKAKEHSESRDGPEDAEGTNSEASRRDLKKEALSIEHLMTHVPKNPWCPTCQRSKMQYKSHRRKSKATRKERFKHWGDCVTADHIITRNKKSLSYMGHKAAIGMDDVASGWQELWAVADKKAAHAKHMLIDVQGDGPKIKLFHSDSSPELIEAAEDLGIPHRKAPPGVKQANSIAERAGRALLEATDRLCIMPVSLKSCGLLEDGSLHLLTTLGSRTVIVRGTYDTRRAIGMDH